MKALIGVPNTTRIYSRLQAVKTPKSRRFLAAPVVITPEIFSSQRRGGVSRYFCELARQMWEHRQPSFIAAGVHFNEHLRTLPKEVVRGFYLSRPNKFRWRINQFLCRRAIRQNRRLIVHQSNFSPYCYEARRLVFTVYDMVEELFPEQCWNPAIVDYLQANKKACCQRANHLIAISECTKTDVVRLYGLNPDKVTVVHLANSLPTADPGPNRVLLEKSYLLYVGVRPHYKNFARLLEAFANSDYLRSRHRLACFGGGPFTAAETELIRAYGLEKLVTQHSGDDRTLAQFYRSAAAFVYPSLYEGFGLPLLEAMGLGCPVICARAGSIPEVAAKAAVYFDPTDTADMQRALETTLQAPVQLEEMSELGRQRERHFSWQRCYRETMAVYEKMARTV